MVTATTDDTTLHTTEHTTMQRLLDVPDADMSYVAHTRDHDDARGFLVYNGPGRFDGAPVVGIVTLGQFSRNRDTGRMHTLWVIRSDMSPLTAAYDGDTSDAAVCGTCPLGPGAPEAVRRNRLCFVALQQAPLAIYRAYHRGSYPRLSANSHAAMSGYSYRACGYGDMAALPPNVWPSLLRHGHGLNMAHTHAWRHDGAGYLSAYAMASCETEDDADDANGLGFRAYMIQSEAEPLPTRRGTVRRPFLRCTKQLAPDAGYRQCNTCGACGGTKGRTTTRAANVATWVHGTPLKGMNPRDLFADRFRPSATPDTPTP